jgi:hypothetical protein
MKPLNHYDRGTILQLMGAYPTDADIPSICEYLEQHPDITTLDVTSSKMGPEGARLLAANIRIPILKIAVNHLGDEGARALAANSSLTTLWIGGNDITDAGAIALAASQTITTLKIGFNKIGDEGARALAANGRFTELHLEGNCITPACAAELEALGRTIGLQTSPPKAHAVALPPQGFVLQGLSLFAGSEAAMPGSSASAPQP